MGQKFHLWNFRNPSAGIVCVYCSVFPSHDFITTLGMFISAVVFSFITIPSFCYFVDLAILVPFRFFFQTSSC